MSEPRQTHILSLEDNERFSYQPGGPVFRVRLVSDDSGHYPSGFKLMVEGPEGSIQPMTSPQEYEGCFVYPIEPEEFDDEESDL